ncbi:MAG TPA: DNA helicase RecG, partial [Clostridiaceae bacterium]|nr:DNA helicase RecG [Clostridiaceae bacterium]
DELPPGRKKVETYVVSPAMRRRIYNFVKSEVQKGRQAYVVCPIIDDSDTLDIESAINTAEKLKKDYLKGIRIGLVHGRLKSEDKDDMLLKFKNGEIDVLVSTTVIEVGIDVPNASVIVVESADRFGLSELHQLRGRVGRGKYKSYCILIADMENEISKERMKIISKTSDGFKISEKDLRLRGTGEFFGVRQHGLPELKIANLFEDINILRETNKLARELVKSGRIYYDEEYSMLRNITGNKF